MRLIVCKNYDDMSLQAAKIVASQIILKPDCVIGLATGSTPVGMYRQLTELNKNGDIDFSEVTTFNLDEYYPIKITSDQSYRYFMNKNLFNNINIKIENTFVPNGETDDPDAECKLYEELIEEHGGIDLQVLGIGQNGHIGFNEPDDNLNTLTHVTDLTESTIKANSRFFNNIDEVPKKALTMGMSTILKSRKILMLVSGKTKHKLVVELLNEGINTSLPATLIKVHPDVVLICDKDAYEG